MSLYFVPIQASELQRAFASLPGGSCALDALCGATWVYQGTEYRQGPHGGRWEHAFLHRSHPWLGGRRIFRWVVAEAGWSPLSDEATRIPSLGALVASMPTPEAEVLPMLDHLTWGRGRGVEKPLLHRRAS